MKKLLTLILTLCLVSTLFAVVPVSAADGEVLVGTPNVDGVLDDIYKQSLTVVYDGDPAKNDVDGDWWDASATFYALYDDKYVYFCAVVKDDDVVGAADAYVLRDKNPYANDCVEFRLDFANNPDKAYNESDTFFKVGVDALDRRKYTFFSDVVDINTCISKSRVTSDGYIIELAVPHSTNEYNQLITSGKLGITYWLFDLHADAEGIVKPINEVDYVHYAIQAEGKANTECSYYNLSTKKVTGSATPTPDITLPADTTTAAPDTTAAPEETTEAPEADTTAAEVEETTAAEVEDTTVAEVEDTTAAEGEDTTEGEDTAEGEDTTVAEDVDTTVAEEETTAVEDEDTTVADEETTAADDEEKGGLPVGVIIAIVAAVVVIAGIAVVLAKKKK